MSARRICVALMVTMLAFGSRARAQGKQHTQSPTGQGSATPASAIKTHDDLQPATLPPLPAGMSIETIVRGDEIYHGKGACFACHGQEAEGLPAAGDALTVALNWAQYDWRSIDSLITAGIPQVLTRSPIQMPPRGGRSDLTPDEVRLVAAYVWAISQTRGEPWAGGHASHGAMVPAGATRGTATRALIARPLPATRRRRP
jgi:cytochrome c5